MITLTANQAIADIIRSRSFASPAHRLFAEERSVLLSARLEAVAAREKNPGNGFSGSDISKALKQDDDAVKISISRQSKERNLQNKQDDTDIEQKLKEKALEDAAEQAKKQIIDELQKRDREVRAHEQAHLSALGPYSSGGPQFEYENGPDGRQYAVSGEVPVDLSEEETPEKTIDKARTVRRAASAPAEPSAKDRQVAGKALQMETKAKAELAREKKEEEGQELGLSFRPEDQPLGEPLRMMGVENYRRALDSQVAQSSRVILAA